MRRLLIPALPVIGCAAVIALGAIGTAPGASAQAGGTIEGVVTLTGAPPPNAPIRMGADPNCLKINAGKRIVQEAVVTGAGGALANAFVVLQGSFSGASGGTQTAPVFDQQGCVYRPRVIGVRVGQAVQIKNSDATLHNIHSLSTKGNDFNTGQPQAGMVFTYTPKAEEVMLHVKCDVHAWMSGYIGIVSHPYFAVSSNSGAFSIAGVPPGKHTIQVWHERFGPLTQTVEVKAGAATKVTFEYTGKEKPAAMAGFRSEEVTIPADSAVLQLAVPAQ